MKKHIVCFGDSTPTVTAPIPGTAPMAVTVSLSRNAGHACWDSIWDRLSGHRRRVGGRTTVFQDPLTEGLCGIDVIFPRTYDA